MNVAFVNLSVDGVKANREHAGGFGAFMHANGLAGRIVSHLKRNFIDLPITGLGTSSSLFRQAGIQVNYYERKTSGEDVIIIVSSLHCHKSEIAFAREEKRRFPKSKIGFCGPFVKTSPQLFNPVADFLIQGEVEATVISYLKGGHNFEGILDHGVVQNLNDLPDNDWNGFPLGRYNYFPLLYKRPLVTLQSTRGCSYDCDYCPYMVSQGKKFRRKNPLRIVDEIEQQIRNWGVKSVLFRDICFTLDKDHARKIAEEILRRKLKIEWACETRIDCLSEELIDIMVASGMRGVNLGLETINHEILERSGKRATGINGQEKVLSYLARRNVRINAFYMVGLVGDTVESMVRTLKYSFKVNSLGAQFCVMTPFPGTGISKKLGHKIMTNDFSQYDEYNPVLQLETCTKDDITQIMKKAYAYYGRPRWMMRHLLYVVKAMSSNLYSGWLGSRAIRRAFP